MVATGVCWFAGSVVGAAVFLHRGPLVHLHISYPTGRLRRRLAVGVVGLGLRVGRGGGRCPRTAGCRWCWRCSSRPRRVDVFTRTSGPARKAGGPALGAALAFAAVLALASANQLLGWDADTPVLLAYDAVVATVSVVLLADLLRGRWTDDTLADLVTGLGRGAGPEGLRGHLRRGLGDPSLTVGFWVPEQGAYVDDEGRPFDVPDGDETRAVTRVEDRGQPLAVLVHDTGRPGRPRAGRRRGRRGPARRHERPAAGRGAGPGGRAGGLPPPDRGGGRRPAEPAGAGAGHRRGAAAGRGRPAAHRAGAGGAAAR